MRFKLAHVHEIKQETALRFYFHVPGFPKKSDGSRGDSRLPTVVSPEEPGGIGLYLARIGGAAAKTQTNPAEAGRLVA